MEPDMYSFSQQNFPTQLGATIKNLWLKEAFTDVTLVSEDKKQIQAHKLVVSAFSPILKDLLIDNPHPNPLLYMRGIKHDVLLSVVQFMYFGQSTIPQENINELLDILKDLQVHEFNIQKNYFKGDESNVLSDDYEAKTKKESLKHESNVQIDDYEAKTTNKSLKYEDDSLIMKEGEKHIFNCQECDSVFTSKKGLIYHTRAKHEGVIYTCNECDYKGSTKSCLRKHQRSRHEGNVYLCNLCSYQATQPSNLKTHNKSKHEGIRYPCTFCEFECGWPSELLKHKRVKHPKF